MVIVVDSEYRGLGVLKPNGEAGIGMHADENGGVIEGYGNENSIALSITHRMLTY
jgi:hypothetical protein